MRPSLRFLALAVVGWAGVRMASAGYLPGVSLFIPRSEARPAPAVLPTAFAPIEPAAEPVQALAPAPQPAAFDPYAQYYAQVPHMVRVPLRAPAAPVYYYGMNSVEVPLPPARPARLTHIAPEPAAGVYADLPPLDDAPLSRLASLSMGERQSRVLVAGQSTPAFASNKLDRLQLTAWALLRGRQGQLLGPSSLASGGQLGGSQAGSRLTYNFTRQLAVSMRTTSDVGRRGAEFALGVRVRPLQSVPVWITAERRQRLGQTSSGLNAFALFAESGVYQRPLPWHFNLDAYLQTGIVGVKQRAWFVDGAAAFTRPVYKNYSAGFGVWGGAQPGLYRIDAGPRVTMKVRNNLRVHLDYRMKLAGNAQPGSGPAVTLAGDF